MIFDNRYSLEKKIGYFCNLSFSKLTLKILPHTNNTFSQKSLQTYQQPIEVPYASISATQTEHKPGTKRL